MLASMVKTSNSAEDRFEEYLVRLASVLGHQDREEPLRAYLAGLCLPGERKSMEPIAARVDPPHVLARPPSLHHFISNAPWDQDAVLKGTRDLVPDHMERHRAREAC